MNAEKNLAKIADFMTARHQIYLARQEGLPAPWTDDPILQEGRFCNIFRELDTVTIWIDKNIRKPFANHPHLWFMLCIARYVNWPPTLSLLMSIQGAWPSDDDFSPAKLAAGLELIAKDGEKVYTGAYMIRAESNPNVEWFHWSKHRYIAEIVLGRLWEDRIDWIGFLEIQGGPREYRSLESIWAKFQEPRYIGWGPFMAYEVVTDLRHTRYANKAPDKFFWANAGPGAIRGLNRLFGRDINAKPKATQTNDEMQSLLSWLNVYTEGRFVATFGEIYPRFEMRDVEHTLCEFDKYERVRLGEGKMRAKYRGGK